MKLLNKILIAISATLIAGTTTASTSIDFRHEWKAEDKKQASRVKMGHNYGINDDWQGNIGIEMKFRSYDATNTFEDVMLTETELDWGYTYKVNRNWELKPGMPIAITDRKTTFKPQLRIVYRADMGLTTALRYRYEIANYADSADGDTSMETGEKINQPHRTKLTLTGAYKIESMPALKLSYEANYIKSHDDVRQYDGKDSDYDIGLKAGYRMGNWQPFTELWDVKVDSKTDQRQMKLRAGVKYYF
ncbi:oligogalacturonate-specific porin KdgM family protein [Psychromonas hadalis]|uniref:oligogalacturonate-specific porin KdgM family protein n=1 Tax=Psychromonas hadalis TaxID=211669 RepID=UPI0003B771D6|nr:oligogalacturonate-specific porin KdgM family protein [Psychromonas hadalis]